MTKKILFVVNPISGGGKARSVTNLIEQTFEKPNYDIKIVQTKAKKKTTATLKRMLKKKWDTIVAVGGDGTINEVAGILAGSEISMGIIPLGSGNGLARHLGIPLNSAKAMDIIQQGNLMVMDIGYVNDKPFVCAAGIGFDAMVADKFSKSRSRGFLNYLIQGTKLFFTYKSKNYHLVIDKETVKRKAFVIAFANASQYGNNAIVAAHADIQDGWIDICLIKNVNWINAIVILASLFLRRLHLSSNVEMYKAKNIQIKNLTNDKMHIDGEVIQVKKNVSIKIKPAELKVHIPI